MPHPGCTGCCIGTVNRTGPTGRSCFINRQPRPWLNEYANAEATELVVLADPYTLDIAA
jgi:hypothetical protein